MTLPKNDPRDAAIWIPGSLVITQPELYRSGLPAEQALLMHTLAEVRGARRRRRPSLLARLKLIIQNA